MERKCKIVGTHDIVERWAKKGWQHAKDLEFCEAVPILLQGGHASFLKNGVENSSDFAVVALRGLSFVRL